MELNIFIGPFLLKNGFSKYKVGDNVYYNSQCTINVLENSYEIFFEGDFGEDVTMYTDSHSIYHLIGILTWYNLIDRNYIK